MRISLHRAPEERDFQIYYANIAHGRTQKDIAVEFDMSQGRVSQIIGGVRKFVRAYYPLQARDKTEEVLDSFLAVDAHEERLRYWDQKTREGYDLTCERIEGKPTRPDVKLIKEGVEISEKRYETAKIVILATNELTRHGEKCPLAREDVMVSDIKWHCRHIKRVAARQKLIGMDVATPEYDANAIERHVRNIMRKDPQRDCRSRETYLPPGWLEATLQAQDQPLDGSPIPEPPAPATPSPAPAPAPVPKSNYIPEQALLYQAQLAAARRRLAQRQRYVPDDETFDEPEVVNILTRHHEFEPEKPAPEPLISQPAPAPLIPQPAPAPLIPKPRHKRDTLLDGPTAAQLECQRNPKIRYAVGRVSPLTGRPLPPEENEKKDDARRAG